MNFSSLLDKHRSDLALVIGNGINRYNPSSNKSSESPRNSWTDLLRKLASQVLDEKSEEILEGVSYTEYYDILQLNQGANSSGKKSLQKNFCDLIKRWKHDEHHKRIVSWAEEAKCPLLTTNFDNLMSDTGEYTLRRMRAKQFSDYYPWESYYGPEKLDNPNAGFGIWHINGMQRYQRSIRLGLTHYMGSVHRVRGWLYRGTNGLFSEDDVKDWRGARTWLDVVFRKPLVIFGLGFEVNEVFLRWLFIERARYFQKFPMHKKDAWYVYVEEKDGLGKLRFLKCMGVEPILARDFPEIYGEATWAK